MMLSLHVITIIIVIAISYRSVAGDTYEGQYLNQFLSKNWPQTTNWPNVAKNVIFARVDRRPGDELFYLVLLGQNPILLFL